MTIEPNDLSRFDSSGMEGLLKSQPSKDVVILGAGFSRAVSSLMPLTDELGREAAQMAGIPLQPGSFEAWLSRLAEPQPYLSQAESTANLATFERLVQAIYRVMAATEAAVVTAGLPAWLTRFALSLQARRAAVITFNYDRLIERAIHHVGLQDFEKPIGEETVEWFDVLGDVPPYPAQPTRLAGSTRPGFRLLKLHGSLNWFWVPGDTSGATLNHWELDDDEADRVRYLPGREPFIVPPAAVKSAFFRNPIMRETWRRAAEALRDAERVALLGYSLPLTDLVSAGMATETLSREGVEIEVVNPDPDPVVASVRFATGRTASEALDVESFVERFVDETSRALSRSCLLHQTESLPDTLILVGWNSSVMAPATGVRRVANGVEVAVDDLADRSPTAPRPNGRPGAISMATLTSCLRPGDVVHAFLSNGSRTRLVAVDRFRRNSGASTRWQVLTPADSPASLGISDPRLSRP